MIRTFSRLKLRLLINGVKRSKNKVALILSIVVAIAVLCFSIIGLIALRNADRAWFPPVVISGLSILMVAWLVLPLLVGMTDGTVDPSRLAHLPIRRHQLITGLLASTLIGIMPICIGFVLLGFLLFANSVGSALVIVVAAFLALLLGSVLAQIGSASLSGLLRGRRTRDIAGAVLGFLAIGGGLLAQFGIHLIDDIELSQLEGFARIVRWTPGGWIGQAMVWSTEGNWFGAVGALLATALALAAAGALWWKLLDQLMTASEARGGSESTGTLVPRLLGSLPGLPPAIKAATARSLKTIRRDPRAWAAMAGQLPMLLLVGFPITALSDENRSAAVLFTGALGLYAGILNSNLFGFDGRAVWLDQLSGRTMRPVLWGKTLAHALIILPFLVIIVFGLAFFTDGWRFVIAGFGLAIASFGCITGVLARSSILHGMPAPEGVNPFAGQGTGQGAAQGFQLMGAFLLGLALAFVPSVLVVGLSLFRWWIGAIAAPLAAAFGLFAWRWGVNTAARAVERDAPEFLQRMTFTQ